MCAASSSIGSTSVGSSFDMASPIPRSAPEQPPLNLRRLRTSGPLCNTLGHDGGMRTEEVCELVGRAARLESCRRDRVSVDVVVDELRRLRAWLDGRQVAAARLLAEVSSF